MSNLTGLGLRKSAQRDESHDQKDRKEMPEAVAGKGRRTPRRFIAAGFSCWTARPKV
jgi:hypothetical protein